VQQQFQKQDESKLKLLLQIKINLNLIFIENNYQTEQKLENKIQEISKPNEQSLAQNSLFQNSRKD
jgi:hypothetical protein